MDGQDSELAIEDPEDEQLADEDDEDDEEESGSDADDSFSDLASSNDEEEDLQEITTTKSKSVKGKGDDKTKEKKSGEIPFVFKGS